MRYVNIVRPSVEYPEYRSFIVKSEAPLAKVIVFDVSDRQSYVKTLKSIVHEVANEKIARNESC